LAQCVGPEFKPQLRKKKEVEGSAPALCILLCEDIAISTILKAETESSLGSKSADAWLLHFLASRTMKKKSLLF
jgi:hypothetical protein